MYYSIDELPCRRSSSWLNGSIPGQGSLEKPLDPRVAENSVTEPTRREACGSICKALLDRGMVITGMVQRVENRYIEDKTDEYTSQQAWSSVGKQYPGGLTRGAIR